MSKIHITEKSLQTNVTNVYAMPFNILYNGSANIKRHFTDSVQECCAASNVGGDGQTTEYTASFRGRPLNGKTLELPNDYVGLICEKENNEHLISTGTFRKITYFNLDCPTTDNDCIVRSAKWLSIAKILHE